MKRGMKTESKVGVRIEKERTAGADGRCILGEDGNNARRGCAWMRSDHGLICFPKRIKNKRRMMGAQVLWAAMDMSRCPRVKNKIVLNKTNSCT